MPHRRCEHADIQSNSSQTCRTGQGRRGLNETARTGMELAGRLCCSHVCNVNSPCQLTTVPFASFQDAFVVLSASNSCFAVWAGSKTFQQGAGLITPEG